MRILFFSDIHFHHTHRFSHITPEGFSVRELEHISCADRIIQLYRNNNIDKVIFGGDLWGPVGDVMSCQVLTAVTEFFRRITEVCPIDVLVGNHDLSTGTNNQIAHKIVPFKYWNNINVYDTPQVVDNFVFMPYCTNDTFAQTFLESVENKKDKIVCSHLEIKGINLGNEIYTQHGVDIDLLKKFKMTLQGHYHSGRNIAKNIVVCGSTQRLSFKDKGTARKNIVIYDTETGEITRENFVCPDWLVFNDDNIESILHESTNNYVKIDVSTDILLTPEIKEKIDQMKNKDIHIDITRIAVNRKVNEEVEGESDLDVLTHFINKSDNDEDQKLALIQEGNRLLNKVCI